MRNRGKRAEQNSTRVKKRERTSQEDNNNKVTEKVSSLKNSEIIVFDKVIRINIVDHSVKLCQEYEVAVASVENW